MPDAAEQRAGLKADLRRLLKVRRRGLDAGARDCASREAAACMMAGLEGFLPATVSAFMALPEEIDTLPLIAALREAGCRVALPRQIRLGEALALHEVLADAVLEAGPFGVREPRQDAPLAEPDIIVVPLLGYDAQGNRLGYGGGFYDRTLQAWRAVRPGLKAIGYAFALQEVDAVPVEPTDQGLDAICTERAFHWFR